MQETINVSVPANMLILVSFAIQIWMIVFPIILIRKLNYITAILQQAYQLNENNDDKKDELEG